MLPILRRGFASKVSPGGAHRYVCRAAARISRSKVVKESAHKIPEDGVPRHLELTYLSGLKNNTALMMTLQDHNKTLGIIYGFLGGLLALAALVELVRIMTLEREMERIRSSTELKVMIPVGLLLMASLLSIAYGLLRRRPWGRILALVSTALSVWLFPLGTALAIYTWWFLYSEGGKQLYSKPTP